MELISKQDRNKLYLQVKHQMGFPIRPFELTDEMLNSYLEMVIEDYSSIVNSWLIQQQWSALEGLDINSGDFLNAFTTKSNHYIESFTYAYSKQVGLGTNAPADSLYELKRDYIVCSANTQHYIIPKNREVNELIWSTPNMMGSGVVDPYALTPWSNGGMMGWGIGGSRPASMVQPIYASLLAAQDVRMKQRVMQSTLTYRITGLASGEKMLHLYPIPGDRNEISTWRSKHLNGALVWYWYYDTSNSSREDCLNQNNDIVRLPSDVETSVLQWSKLNDVAKQQIRNLFIAKVKMAIGGIRAFYSGKINADTVLEYRHLLDEGIALKEETEKTLLDQLEKLRQVNLTEEKAKIAQSINQALGYQPFRNVIFPI